MAPAITTTEKLMTSIRLMKARRNEGLARHRHLR
jgi:hypothetical protein